jgi:RNA recognition motif-containing protein
MVVVSIWLLMNVEDKAEEINNEVSTPADFTVFVRNLPKDVSEGALLAHFSMRYNKNDEIGDRKDDTPLCKNSFFSIYFFLEFFFSF